MSFDLDPVFVRALRLLHSKSQDSSAQLKSMLDDAIRHRKGMGPGPTGAIISKQKDPRAIEAARRESEKRNLDHLKHELSQLVPGGGKRMRLDSPRSSSAGFSSKSHTPSPTPPGSRGDFDEHSSSGGNSSPEGSGGTSSGPPPIRFSGDDIDINLEGLNDCTCYVCKSFNQENGNKLMECHTCQNLFHQECHVPVVTNEEANDPRFIWNCSECTRKNPALSKPYKPGSRASPSKFVSKPTPGLASFNKSLSAITSSSSRSSRGGGSSTSSSSSSSSSSLSLMMKKKARNKK